jgi:restriction system protein
LMTSKHPEDKPGTIKSWGSQLYRFLEELKAGDTVVTYDQEQRLYYIGSICSGTYSYAPIPDVDLAHTKAVQWAGKVQRDTLSASTRNSLGAIQTLFKIPTDAINDLKANLQPMAAVLVDLPAAPPKSEEPAERAFEDDLRKEILGKADSFIEDAISRLDWEQMQELMAGILRAMGYRTRVAPPGPDRGYDIFASPDGLGLQEPRIFVEVKHRKDAMGAPQIRSFLGGRSPGDRCLYVSTGGFTREAKYEAERSSTPLQLVDLSIIRDLLKDHYEKVDAETRALVPLKRFYWPV